MKALRRGFYKGVQHRQRARALERGSRLADALAVETAEDPDGGILREGRVQSGGTAFQEFLFIWRDAAAGSGRSRPAAVREYGKNAVLDGYPDPGNPGVNRERLFQNPGRNGQPGGVILHKAGMAVHMAHAHVA